MSCADYYYNVPSFCSANKAVFHRHYLYEMSFNKVKKAVVEDKCCLQHQAEKKIAQSNEGYWNKSKDLEDFVAFVSENHCIYIKTTKAVDVRDANPSRDFSISCVTDINAIGLEEVVLPLVPTWFVKWVKESGLVMTGHVTDSLLNARNHMIRVVQQPDPINRIDEVVKLFDDLKQFIKEKERKVPKDVQYTAWLLNELCLILQPRVPCHVRNHENMGITRCV